MIRRDYRRGDRLTADTVNRMIDAINKFESLAIQGYNKINTATALQFRRQPGDKPITAAAAIASAALSIDFYQVSRIDEDGDRLWCRKWDLVNAPDDAEVEVWKPPTLARSSWLNVTVNGVTRGIFHGGYAAAGPDYRVAWRVNPSTQAEDIQSERITEPYYSMEFEDVGLYSAIAAAEMVFGSTTRLYDLNLAGRAWAQMWVVRGG